MPLNQRYRERRRGQVKISILAECYTNECLARVLCEELRGDSLICSTKHSPSYGMPTVIRKLTEICKRLGALELLLALVDYEPNSVDRVFIDAITFNDQALSRGIHIRQVRCEGRAYAIILDPRVEDVLGESREFKVKLRNPDFLRVLKSRDVCRKHVNLFKSYIESNRAIVDRILEKIVRHTEG